MVQPALTVCTHHGSFFTRPLLFKPARPGKQRILSRRACGTQSRSNRAIHIGMVTMQDRVVSTLIAEAYFASRL